MARCIAEGARWCRPRDPVDRLRHRRVAGKTHCHAHSTPAMGSFRSKAPGSGTRPPPAATSAPCCACTELKCAASLTRTPCGRTVTRSTPPLPRRIRISPRSRSTSLIRSVRHSSNRVPLPYRRSPMIPYVPRSCTSARAASARESATGNRVGVRARGSHPSSRSGRSMTCLYRNRSADNAGACVAVATWRSLGQVAEESDDVRLPQIGRMRELVVTPEPGDPIGVRLLGSPAIGPRRSFDRKRVSSFGFDGEGRASPTAEVPTAGSAAGLPPPDLPSPDVCIGPKVPSHPAQHCIIPTQVKRFGAPPQDAGLRPLTCPVECRSRALAPGARARSVHGEPATNDPGPLSDRLMPVPLARRFSLW